MSAVSDVGRDEVGFRFGFRENFLCALGGGYPDAEASVFVVIVHEHEEYFFATCEEGGLAVGDFFGGLGVAVADFTDSGELFVGLGLGGHGCRGFLVLSTDVTD